MRYSCQAVDVQEKNSRRDSKGRGEGVGSGSVVVAAVSSSSSIGGTTTGSVAAALAAFFCDREGVLE